MSPVHDGSIRSHFNTNTLPGQYCLGAPGTTGMICGEGTVLNLFCSLSLPLASTDGFY